jgi:threonine/homoserine/homoserine lactone efflux protein
VIPEPETLAVFCLAALALLVVPGPAVLYIVASSIDGGRRAGAASMLGIQTGALVHVFAAALGLSGLLAASALAFDTVKYLGAAYLIAIGLWTLLRGGSPTDADEERPPTRYRRRFAQGVVVQILNPKTALFFLAFLPQFVTVSRGAVVAQILGLGLVFCALGLLTDGLYALTAGSAAHWLRARRGVALTRRWIPGTMYIGLGLATALSASNRK